MKRFIGIAMACSFCVSIITPFDKCFSQGNGLLPRNTRWYQNPLEVKPLQLSTAPGIVWGLVAVASSVLFTSNDPQHSNNIQFDTETGGSYGYKQPYTNVFTNDIRAIRSFRKWYSAG